MPKKHMTGTIYVLPMSMVNCNISSRDKAAFTIELVVKFVEKFIFLIARILKFLFFNFLEFYLCAFITFKIEFIQLK